MKNGHSIQSRIMRLAILPTLLISVILLAYDATIGAIANGTELAKTVAASFDSVSKITDEVERDISEISAASEKQYACIETVCEKMSIISAEVKNTSVSADKSSAIGEKLLKEADTLNGHISRFTLQ